MLLIDFKKGYDLLDRPLLHKKLESVNIEDLTLLKIRAIHANAKAVINGKRTGLNKGHPQGSVLSLLF